MRNFVSRIVPAALAAVQLMIAAGPVEPLNRSRDGVAVRGYDVVSYFTAGKPVKGAPEFSYQWMGATWRFASAQIVTRSRRARKSTLLSSAGIAHGRSGTITQPMAIRRRGGL